MPISRFISGGAAGSVGAPTTTSQSVAAGATLANVTFGAFSDPDGVIVSYSASVTSSGSATVSGSGLGPWSINGAVDGESGVLTLDALDSSGNVVGTAVHVWSVGKEEAATAWKLLTAADATLDADPNALLTTFTDSGDEMQFRGSAHSSVNAKQGAQYIWQMVNPDTDAVINWQDGGFMGVEFMFKVGTETTDSLGEFCFFAVKQDGVDTGRAGGVGFDTTDRLFHTNFSASSSVGTTLGSDDLYMINVDLYDSETANQSFFASTTVNQFDDSASPGYISQALRGGTNLTSATADLRLYASFSGDIDVTCYYRFIKLPLDHFA